MYNDISLRKIVIPGLTEPAPYLIRGNPVFTWIPAFAGMTRYVVIYGAVYVVIYGAVYGISILPDDVAVKEIEVSSLELMLNVHKSSCWKMETKLSRTLKFTVDPNVLRK